MQREQLLIHVKPYIIVEAMQANVHVINGGPLVFAAWQMLHINKQA